MKVFRGFEQVKGIKNPVVTTGTFDGVHIGHKTILNRLRILAEKYNGESVLITFDPHPRKVLYPETAGKSLRLISSQEEKLQLLDKAGLDNVIIVEFTREFSKVTSEEFVSDYLHDILKARIVVVGFNHHFGFNKEGDYKQLWALQERYNFVAEEIPEQEVQNETVSSTKIRQAIAEGYIQRANAYLDHYYIVTGIPEKFFFENESGIPPLLKIPLTEECKLLPSEGIYAVSLEAGDSYSRGMVIIHGSNSQNSDVLLNIFDDTDISPSRKITISFHKKIRGAVNIFDTGSSGLIRSAMEEISDLIY